MVVVAATVMMIMIMIFKGDYYKDDEAGGI